MATFSGIDHIDIVVSDPEEMREFLERVGFTLVRRTDHGGGAIELRFPGPGKQPVLELTSVVDGNGVQRPLGFRHLALGVDDLDEAYVELGEQGLTIDKPPRVIPLSGRRLFNIVDPLGKSLQVVEDE